MTTLLTTELVYFPVRTLSDLDEYTSSCRCPPRAQDDVLRCTLPDRLAYSGQHRTLVLLTVAVAVDQGRVGHGEEFVQRDVDPLAHVVPAEPVGIGHVSASDSRGEGLIAGQGSRHLVK